MKQGIIYCKLVKGWPNTELYVNVNLTSALYSEIICLIAYNWLNRQIHLLLNFPWIYWRFPSTPLIPNEFIGQMHVLFSFQRRSHIWWFINHGIMWSQTQLVGHIVTVNKWRLGCVYSHIGLQEQRSAYSLGTM